MAHYAFLDENNTIVDIIVGIDETKLIEGLNPETWYGNFKGLVCKRTSYNTLKGVHTMGGTPFRKNYAIIGGTYSFELDAFIAPKILESSVFNEETCSWDFPVEYPDDGNDYIWNEE